MSLGGDNMRYNRVTCLIIIVMFLVGTFLLIELKTIFKPIKYAVEMKNEHAKSEEYIICQLVKITGFKWRTLDGELINVNGCDQMDIFCSYGIEYGNNKFILYGEFSSNMYEFDGEFFREFNCKNWDIIYPVNRDVLFNSFMPKRYLCEFDKSSSK